MISALKLITLDLTGTVFKFKKPPFVQYAEVASAFHVDVDPDQVKASFLTHWRAMNELHPNFGAATHGDSRQWWMDLVRRTIMGAVKADTDEERLGRIGSHLYELYATTEPYEIYPDALSLLQHLDRRRASGHLKVGLVSNFDQRIERVTEELGIRQYTDFLVHSEGANASKPQAQIFQGAVECSQLKSIVPSAILHIGDDVDRDYHGAKTGLGWNSFLLNRSGSLDTSSADPDHVFSDMHQVCSALGL